MTCHKNCSISSIIPVKSSRTWSLFLVVGIFFFSVLFVIVPSPIFISVPSFNGETLPMCLIFINKQNEPWTFVSLSAHLHLYMFVCVPYGGGMQSLDWRPDQPGWPGRQGNARQGPSHKNSPLLAAASSSSFSLKHNRGKGELRP